MWRSWGRSPTQSPSQSPSSSKPDKRGNHIFRCSSFKDVENLTLGLDNKDDNNNNNDDNISKPGLKRQASTSVFNRVCTANALIRQWPIKSDAPKTDTRVVIYYTSLRVVRPTFEACRAVLSILQGFRVAVDQRDLAMDAGFMTELRELLGLKNGDNAGLSLPRVFVGGRYIGGAEEVKYLHEIGELKDLIAGLPLVKPGTCRVCGGYRFILCTHCSGSRKIYSDKTGLFRTCSVCNENGLIRCPHCSSPPPRPALAPIS